MEVYIVTSGSYSDYGIRRVFLNKENADKYAKLSSNRYESYYVETYNTSDDLEINEITYVHIVYTKWEDGDIDFDFNIHVASDVDYSESELNNTEAWVNAGYKSVEIKRAIDNKFDEDEIENRYRNVCYELMSQVESLVELEGWTEEMVDKWLSEKVEVHFG